MWGWRLLAGLGAALNVLDGILTCQEIEHHLAIESNGWMAYLYSAGSPFFWVFKIAAVACFLYLLHHCQDEKKTLARVGIALGFSAYASVFLWHLMGLLA